MIDAILFDLDNTLVDRSAAHQRYALDLLARFPGLVPPDEQEAALREAHEADRWGYRDRLDYCRWVVERFPGLGMTGEELWDDYRARLAGFVEPEPPVLELLTGLAPKYRLGVVSNGSGSVQRRKLEAAGLVPFFPTVVISGEAGVHKPDPAIFAPALKGLGTPPEATIYVGDHPDHDVHGARAAGLRVCWVSMNRTYPEDQPPPDWTVASVCELPGVLP